MLRAALHEKVGMALDELPDPALVADQIVPHRARLPADLRIRRPSRKYGIGCEIGYELRFAQQQMRVSC